MSLKIGLVALSAIVCCAAQAQLILGTYSQTDVTNNAGFVVGPEGSVETTIVGNQVSALVNGMFTAEPTLGNSSSSIVFNQYSSFSTGLMPIELSDFSASFDGSFIYGGGDMSGTINKAQFSLSSSIGIYEYTDANGNGAFDLGEAMVEVLGTGSVQLAELAGNGVVSYSQVAQVPGNPSYILAADHDYVIFSQTEVSQLGSTPLGIPSITLMSDYSNAASAGNQFGFTFQAVPEPTTMLVAGFAGVIALFRKLSK